MTSCTIFPSLAPDLADHDRALIATQAGVERRDMAVVTSFRK